MSGLETLLESLGKSGSDFERLCKWLLENAPEYRARLERVWLWDEWPGRWAADAGIDLVAEDRDGGLWAVQAKHYDPAYAIKKADLDSFLSESSRPGFTFRLLIASTDHLGPTARRTLAGQEKPVGTMLRSDLTALAVPWPQSIVALRPATPKPKTPRPHQVRAVRETMRGLEAGDRGQVVMACGTGKTLVARFLHDEMASRRTLVLVPSLSLLKQSLREWLANGAFDYLAVCSDTGVTPDDRDALVGSTSELGVPVTTDPAGIAAFLNKQGDCVVFATYQSSPQIAEAQSAGTPFFDLVIADEAHRCAGPEAGVFATVLDPAKIKAHKRVFMTATPRWFTGRLRREAHEADWEIASMDDEAKFGPVLHRLAFAQAIKQELLSDYQVVVVAVTDTSYRGMAERGAFVTTDGETVTDARTLARQIGLLRVMRNHDLHRVVSFHSRISYANRFAKDIQAVAAWMPEELRPDGTLWADHVSGEMTTGERETWLNRLRAVSGEERGLLANARCLAEGVDVPTLDGVAFIDPRRSEVDIVQAVGRAIRKADDKKIGTVVIPVFVDEDADPEQALESSEFERVWKVVKALRAHDDALAERLDQLRRERGQYGRSSGSPDKIVLDLPAGIGDAFSRAFDSLLVSRTTANWEEGLGAAAAYRATYGHLRVPRNFVTHDGFKLGVWVHHCRRARNRGDLAPERIAVLDALGMVWGPYEEDWQFGLAAARSYREAYGHLRVPWTFVKDDGFRLGIWINTRRIERRTGRLTAQRIAELDALDMVWDPLEEDWERGIAAARAYREANGHLRVPQGLVTDEGFRLGVWSSNRRIERKEGRLRADRIAELDALDMVWDPLEEDWERGIAAARAYREANGHLLVPHKFVTDEGLGLGNWISNRRIECKEGRLRADRIAELDALDMVWDPLEEDWQRGIAAARAYRATYGHLRVPSTFVTHDGFKLGSWISKRRTARNRGDLAPERMAELDALDMVWDPRDEDWQRGIAAARAYRDAHGHLLVPVKFITDDGFRLGKWISSRRRECKRRGRGRLSAERIAELDALDMVWGPRSEDDRPPG